MKLRKTFLSLLACLTTLCAPASSIYAVPLPSLHVEGRYLCDTHGNRVTLHGVMDTPSPYFNGWRWTPWVPELTDAHVQPCLDYFEKIYTAMTDNDHGAYCDVFRLHLDPCWTNDPSKKSSGENDISVFSKDRFNHFLDKLYIPLMQKAMNHGMYVVVRPPGVCPGEIKVGDDYQKYLLYVWDVVSKNPIVKANAGAISIELANEPVKLYDAQGKETAVAMHDFFQPIVDKIRANGFTGIIWVPGTGWQANYRGYASHPIEGENIGYAVHDYVGWYGADDTKYDAQTYIQSFTDAVPVVMTNPVIITEVDWSPEKEGTGHYNEHGEYVKSNWGTWATGSTSKWGSAFKALMDHYDNISMTLSSTACYLDIDKYINSGIVAPNFDGNPETCAGACWQWYKDWAEVNRAWPDNDNTHLPDPKKTTITSLQPVGDLDMMAGKAQLAGLKANYQDGHTEDVSSLATYEVSDPENVKVVNGQILAKGQGKAQVTAKVKDAFGNSYATSFNVRSSFFPLSKNYVKVVWEQNGSSYDETTHTFVNGQYGQTGWTYSDGVDLSAYKYLVVKLKEPDNNSAKIFIYPQNNIWAKNNYEQAFDNRTQIVVPLHTMKSQQNGSDIDPSKIYIVALWSLGGKPITIDDIYVTNNNDYSPMTGISAPSVDSRASNSLMFGLNGVRVQHPSKHQIVIQKGKKVIY